jgi:hypothetical protein
VDSSSTFGRENFGALVPNGSIVEYVATTFVLS